MPGVPYGVRLCEPVCFMLDSLAGRFPARVLVRNTVRFGVLWCVTGCTLERTRLRSSGLLWSSLCSVIGGHPRWAAVSRSPPPEASIADLMVCCSSVSCRVLRAASVSVVVSMCQSLQPPRQRMDTASLRARIQLVSLGASNPFPETHVDPLHPTTFHHPSHCRWLLFRFSGTCQKIVVVPLQYPDEVIALKSSHRSILLLRV